MTITGVSRRVIICRRCWAGRLWLVRKGRPVSDASQVSTTPSGDTDASGKSEVSTASSISDWQVTGAGGEDGEEKRLSNAMTMANIDGMLRELRLLDPVDSHAPND
jgi:hypothetical protein